MSDRTKEEIEYEDRLRRRLKILLKQMKADKIHINEDLQVINSLKAVRYQANGEIDLSTVDGSVRAMALAVTAMHDREELKKSISLSEIQNMYFEFFSKNFSHFFEIMKKRKMTPHDAGRAARNGEGSIKEVMQFRNGLLDFIDQFWSELGDIAHIHVEDMHNNIKGVFGGDLFPSNEENIASKCGIYTDTIILPDPFLRTRHIFERAEPAEQVYFIIKHAMNILQYKELACADVDIPIIVILPDISELEAEEKQFNYKLGESDTLIHSAKLFNRKFESIEELLEFASTLDTVEQTLAEVSDKSRILFDYDWQGDAEAQLRKAVESKEMKLIGIQNPGTTLVLQSIGRMATANELLIKASRLKGTPILDAPTSWQYLTWKMEYDADRTESTTNVKDLHITRGLQNLANGDMEWLGNIPVEALIQIRKEGAIEEIRSILGNGINELTNMNPSNYHRTSDQIFENINEAFEKHKVSIKELKSKQWKFAGSDMGSWFVKGTLGVTAAITGAPVWAIAALALDQVSDAPKLKDIPKSIRDLIDENNKIKRSPVGMLFNIKNKSR